LPRIVDLERAYLAAGPTQIKIDFVKQPQKQVYVPSAPVELRVKLIVHNTGRTAATIKKIYEEFSDLLPQSPTYDSVQPILTDLSIAAGKESVLDPFEFQSDFVGPQFFWGYIEYVDIFKNKRVSRFCTHLEPDQGKYQIAGEDPWRDCD
jgi:hypothetical protein